MLHFVVLLAALSAAANRPTVFVPVDGRETVVGRLPTTSVDTVHVAADDGTSEWQAAAPAFDEWTPQEGGTRFTAVTGGERRRKIAPHRTTRFAELRFEILRR